jgi:lysozyme family protein
VEILMNFRRCFEIVIGNEGGYVNDPHDPGGETNYGISKRAYPHLDIANLTLEDAMSIYEEDYWNAIQADCVASCFRLAYFDCAVNQGTTYAIQALQAMNGLTVDGIFGPRTIAAGKRMTEEDVSKYLASRSMRYIANDNFNRYGKGWLTRLFRVAMNTKES